MRLMSIRRLVLGLIPSSLCVLAAAALLSSTPAFATEVHVFKSSFGGEGTGPGQFKGPHGVAVNSVTHDVYVVDSGNNRVEEFTAAGVYIGQFNGSGAPCGTFSEPTEIAVDNSQSGLDPSKEDVYVVDNGHGVIDKFDSSGTCIGQITGTETPEVKFEAGQGKARSITGVTVDPSGSVWVGILKGPIYSFDDALANKYLSERETNPFGTDLGGLGVDSEDDLYINACCGEFVKVDSSGKTLLAPFNANENGRQVAVDPVGREVYIDSGEAIEAFSLGGASIESFGTGHLSFSEGVAVDSSDGTVYATNRVADGVAIFEEISLPSVSVEPAGNQSPRSLTLNGSVNPEGNPVVSCVFEYATASEYAVTKAYGHSVDCSPAAASIGSGVSAVAVSASLVGLAPQSAYDYRLVAENAAHLPSATANQEFFTGPKLEGEFVTGVTASSAVLHAAVDPNGGDTHYYFQYGLSSDYGSYAPVSPPGMDIGSAVGVQGVSVEPEGLEAGTVYHYRLVAEQSGETFAEPDHSFMTQGSGELASAPDGRAWELVSPANKRGTLIELFLDGGQLQAAGDGSGIAYVTKALSVEENPAGKVTYAQVLSRRGSAGWGSTDLTLPGLLPENGEPSLTLNSYEPEYRLFSQDLVLAAVEPQGFGTPPLSGEETERTLYLRNNMSGSFTALVSGANAVAPVEEKSFVGAGVASEFEMHFLAGTPDLGHVVFKTPKALTPDAIDEETVKIHSEERLRQWNLYEWGGGQLQLVNILPGNEGVAHGQMPVPGVRLAGVVNTNGLGRGGAPRAISNDGRRIAWAWGEPYTQEHLPYYRGLYVRDMVEKKTLRVGGADPVYQTMNSDGSKVFFLENSDLYEFSFSTGKQVDLTGVHGLGESSAHVQETVSDVSEGGSYVYFVASGVLAAGGESGKTNLYVLHNTGSGWESPRYIATLSAEDRPSWFAEGNFGVPFLSHMSSRVSPNGRYLAFMSNRSLTGYDNVDAVSGVADEEVYLYDAQAGKLVCASCDPTGARPVGVFDTHGVGNSSPASELLVDRQETWTANETSLANPRTDHWLAGSIPGWDNLNNDPPTYQPRYLSDSGRLFFDSPVGLVSQDTNGLEDVYEFEPEGVGNCASSTVSGAQVYVSELAGHPVGGCVGLISSGTSGSESAFFDASENGGDVFFATTSKLVGEDYDKGYDVYDAHVCTTVVPCETPPVGVPPCESGDSCKAAPSPQPTIFGPAPSATFNGAGNIAGGPSVGSKRLTNAQKLIRALRACHRKRGGPRGVCERQARKRYPVKQARKAGATRKRKG